MKTKEEKKRNCKHKNFITRIISTPSDGEWIEYICLDDGIKFRQQKILDYANSA